MCLGVDSDDFIKVMECNSTNTNIIWDFVPALTRETATTTIETTTTTEVTTTTELKSTIMPSEITNSS